MITEEFMEIAEESTKLDYPAELLSMVKYPDRSMYYKFLYLLAKRTMPRLIVELGTNKGVSALHFKMGHGGARIITVDIKQKPEIVLLLNSYKIQTIISDSIEVADNIPNGIDIIFMDTHRLKEYEIYLPKMRMDGIILIDDIHLNNDMEQAWREIKGNKIDLSFLHPVPGFGAILV